MATVTVNTEDATKQAWAQAAEAAGMSLSAWLAKAADDKMIRDAVGRYHQVLADHPEFAAEVTRARQFALASAARVRATVVAKYGQAL